MPSPVRTVIVADFDSDNELEVFFNNIAYRGSSANRLFRYTERLSDNSCKNEARLNAKLFKAGKPKWGGKNPVFVDLEVALDI